MNEDEQEIDQKFIDAYNAGYLLQRYEPELMQKIVTAENKQSDFVNAMDAGSRQYDQEKMRQQDQKRDKIIAEQQRQRERQQNLKPKRYKALPI